MIMLNWRLRFKQSLSLVLTASMLVSLVSAVGTASAAEKAAATTQVLSNLIAASQTPPAQGRPSDLDGAWAEMQIGEWLDKGLVKGYPDGTFRPDATITRAETAALINRAFDFKASGSNPFTDVPEGRWYAAEVSKAQAAGYMKGNGNGVFRPEANIKRQEAAVMLARLLELKADKEAAAKFSDASSIPNWSIGEVGASVEAGLINGYPDRSFKPDKPLTRAEAIVILNRALGMKQDSGTVDAGLPAEINQAGVYGPEKGTASHKGDLTINAPDVTLRNVTIEGNLVLGEGIGEGDVTLKGVTVKGTTSVRGGGPNSVHLMDSALTRIIVTKVNGQVRVVIEGSTEVDRVVIESGATLQIVGGGGASYGTIEISTTGEVILNGNFPDVVLLEAATVTVTGGSIDKLTVTDHAAGAKIDIREDAKVNDLNVGAPATITGKGAINNATVTSDGVKIEQKPDNLGVLDGVKADVGGQQVQGGNQTPSGGSSPGTNVTAVSVTVSDPGPAGMTLSLSPALPGLQLSDLILANPDGVPAFNAALRSSDNGATYRFSGILRGGDTYRLSMAKTGYSFGASKSVTIPDLTTFSGAMLSPDANRITLFFTHELAEVPAAPAGFKLISEEASIDIVTVENTGKAQIDLILASAVKAESLHLSYTPGTISSIGGKPLVAFETTYVVDGTKPAGAVTYSKINGKTVAEATADLQERFEDLNNTDIGAALLEGGYTGVEVAKILSTEFNNYEDQIARFLLDHGYGMTQMLITLQEAGILNLLSIGKAMMSIGMKAEEFVAALKFTGFDLDQAYEATFYFLRDQRYAALRKVYGLSEDQLAAFLNAKAVSAREAAELLMKNNTSTQSSVITALAKANYTEEQIAEILKGADLFRVNAFRATTLLFDAGLDANAAAKIMKTVYEASAGEIVSALAQHKLSIEETIEVIGKGSLGFTQEERWKGLRSAYTTEEIAKQYHKWQWSASDVIHSFAAAKFPIEEVEKAVTLVYTGGVLLDGSIPDMLWANYSLQEVAAGMKRSGDGIKKVAELLTSKGYKNVFDAADGEETIVDMLLKAGYSTVEIAQYLRPFGSNKERLRMDEIGRVLLQFKAAGFTAVELTDTMWKMLDWSTGKGTGPRGFVVLMKDMTDLTTNSGRRLTKFSDTDIPRVLAAFGIKLAEHRSFLTQRFTNNEIAGLLKESFSLTPSELVDTMKGSNGGFCGRLCTPLEVLRILKSLYSDLTFEQAAATLLSSGVQEYQRLSDLAFGIQEVYGSQVNLVPMLRTMGFSLKQLAVENAYKGRTATFWRSNGYTAAEVYSILNGQSSSQRFNSLKGAGYNVYEIMLAAQQNFATMALAINALTEINLFPTEDINRAAAEIYGQDPKQAMAAFLRNNQNSSSSNTANTLRWVYQVNSPIDNAKLLKGAGYSQDEVLTAVFNVFCTGNAFLEGTYTTLKTVIADLYPNVTDPMAASLKITGGERPAKGIHILKTLGYTTVQIVTVLKEQYGLNAGSALDTYNDVGTARPIEILTAVSTVYNVEAMSFVATKEKEIGRDAYSTRTKLKSNYGFTDEIAIARALSEGGYSRDQVLVAMFNQSGDRNTLVASVLKQVYGVTALDNITLELRKLGETVLGVYQALRAVFPNADSGDVIRQINRGGFDLLEIYRRVLYNPKSDANTDSTIIVLHELGLDAALAMDLLDLWGYKLKDNYLKLKEVGYTSTELREAILKTHKDQLEVAKALAQAKLPVEDIATILYVINPRYDTVALYLYGTGWYDPAQLANGLLAAGCAPEDIITVMKSMVSDLLLDMILLKKIEAPLPEWKSTYMAMRLSWTNMSLDELTKSFMKAVEAGKYKGTDMYWGLRELNNVTLDYLKEDLSSDAGDFLFDRRDGIPFMLMKEAGLSAHDAARIMSNLGIKWQPAIMFLVQADYSSSNIASAFFSQYSLDVLFSVAEIIGMIATAITDGFWGTIKNFILMAGKIAYNISMKNYRTKMEGNPNGPRS
ncbi:S-layer homology domain-containing protein [Paenibacillus sp. GCM10012307]|uniref:S-layer homology domain-containing protein n=1 Tax=Paenibacillus roseus TaxID=2798579 RepID=A0A934IW43_9BACL|nr:S-layer homology domain-containing protein [Paenibacillus roseus]MBJ6360391.1 S-layer homology domain-containing protein [Paenibacillus roseus]